MESHAARVTNVGKSMCSLIHDSRKPQSSKPSITTRGQASNSSRKVTRYWSFYLMTHLNSWQGGRAHMK